MKTNNIILLGILAIILIAILSYIGFGMQNTTQNNTTNDTINVTINNTTNDTQNNTTTETTKTTTKNTKTSEKKSSDKEYGTYINDEYVSMSEKEYAERFPALYHEQSLQEGKYDKYHPEFYEVDRENGRI